MAPWLTRRRALCAPVANFGKSGLTAGIDRAAGMSCLLMEADLQNPGPGAGDGQRLGGAPNGCAARASRADESWLKRIGTAVFYHSSTATRRCRSRSMGDSG